MQRRLDAAIITLLRRETQGDYDHDEQVAAYCYSIRQWPPFETHGLKMLWKSVCKESIKARVERVECIEKEWNDKVLL